MAIERHQMKLRYCVLLALGLFIAGCNYTFAYALERTPGPVKPDFSEPHEIVDIYLKAVSRGELIVFDRKLDKSMITPVRVEYIYDINSTISSVTVYSELKQPIPAPENCSVRGVSATLDSDGHIIEVKAHIWAD
jgi:hypothetical protein